MPLFFFAKRALAPTLLSAARLAVRVVDRALLLIVNVTAPVRSSDCEAAVSEGPSRAGVPVRSPSNSARHSATGATHRGPIITDAEARRVIRDWERRTRTDDVCTADAWALDPLRDVRSN